MGACESNVGGGCTDKGNVDCAEFVEHGKLYTEQLGGDNPIEIGDHSSMKTPLMRE